MIKNDFGLFKLHETNAPKCLSLPPIFLLKKQKISYFLSNKKFALPGKNSEK
jgi:hypothetical protein